MIDFSPFKNVLSEPMIFQSAILNARSAKRFPQFFQTIIPRLPPPLPCFPDILPFTEQRLGTRLRLSYYSALRKCFFLFRNCMLYFIRKGILNDGMFRMFSSKRLCALVERCGYKNLVSFILFFNFY